MRTRRNRKNKKSQRSNPGARVFNEPYHVCTFQFPESCMKIIEAQPGETLTAQFRSAFLDPAINEQMRKAMAAAIATPLARWKKGRIAKNLSHYGYRATVIKKAEGEWHWVINRILGPNEHIGTTQDHMQVLVMEMTGQDGCDPVVLSSGVCGTEDAARKEAESYLQMAAKEKWFDAPVEEF